MKDVFDAANSNAFDSYSFIASIPNADSRYYKLEGISLSGYIQLLKGQNVQSVLKTMLNNYQTKTANINWQNAAGLTKEQVMTLASIVQRESTATDRANVASVFVNRLKSGNAGQCLSLAGGFYNVLSIPGAGQCTQSVAGVPEHL